MDVSNEIAHKGFKGKQMNNRKVRKDFDIEKEYSVDVSNCTEEEKKEVQQAFFDVGMPWATRGENYGLLNAAQYTNATGYGNIYAYLMFSTDTEGCNMTAEEFLDLVYEPGTKSHIHADSMALYAEDAKTTTKPWELWQFEDVDGTWYDLERSPMWEPKLKYRRKPRTKLVHGVEVPDIGLDLSKCEGITNFYAPCVRIYEYHVGLSHSKHNDCTRFSQIGIAYPYTEEGKQAAILHAKAMLGIDPHAQEV